MCATQMRMQLLKKRKPFTANFAQQDDIRTHFFQHNGMSKQTLPSQQKIRHCFRLPFPRPFFVLTTDAGGWSGTKDESCS
jgi:hypothetical protein